MVASFRLAVVCMLEGNDDSVGNPLLVAGFGGEGLLVLVYPGVSVGSEYPSSPRVRRSFQEPWSWLVLPYGSRAG